MQISRAFSPTVLYLWCRSMPGEPPPVQSLPLTNVSQEPGDVSWPSYNWLTVITVVIITSSSITSISAYVKPTATTLTVNLGYPATLAVSGSSDGVVWEKRNVGNKLAEGTSLAVTPQATEAHQGSYVLYRQADGYTALVGVTRLIVRGCPKNKYGPTCRFPCPTCHHGGWCDDVSGECVCPPGFMGKNCEIGCPRINFGQSCQWDCNNADIDGDNDDPDCRQVMLCLPDPYGCSCARGWKGLDCQTQCAAGEYGAGCTQLCDCKNGGTCDPVKGCVCVGDWSGPTCEDKKFRLVVDPPSLHITNADVTVTSSCHPWGEDDCPELTVLHVGGDQALQSPWRFPDNSNSRWKVLRFTPEQKLATLLFNCSASSEYQETTEFIVTGMFPQVARFGTVRSPSNTASIELNTGTDVTFVCETTGDPLPQAGDVNLTFSGRKLVSSTEMSTRGTTVHSSLLRNVSITDAGQYDCRVMTVAGQDDRVVSVVVKVPPTTTVPPPVRSTSPTELTVDVQLGKLDWRGDGEIIAIEIEYKQANESAWDILSNTEEGEVRITNLSRNTTYDVRLVLSRPGEGGRGRPGPTVTVTTLEMTASSSSSIPAIAGGAVAAALVLLLLVGLGIFMWRRKKEWRNASKRPTDVDASSLPDETTLETPQHQTRHKQEHSSSKPATIVNKSRQSAGDTEPPYHIPLRMMGTSDLELGWKDISLSSKLLGAGNFGEVRKGTVKIDGDRIQSAIKVLKRGADEESKDEFQQEVDIMRHVGFHPNIINLLGVCNHKGQQYMALELATNGDLLKYLRKSRVHVTEKPYANMRPEVQTASTLSPVLLLRIAGDVASGMEHLAAKDVIHRDLAARNVLLTDRLIAKVADFGLSRGEGIYEQKSRKAIPFRSTAIEALSTKIYTTKSDVWSFGILLWEIVTLGGTPYSGMKSRLLMRGLHEGYRLPKPRNCEDALYVDFSQLNDNLLILH
ncbi:TIE1 [Branchiostoma lanceolatum]|uniref:receptor protein-tyrosine kinase n=1 Tax=Branchiostoma lanceolatum TaxID=7740 RepID=A0A8J9ZXS2_BRALA|nr:TIE1 [Branchiostoma lanceolatum]